MSVRVTRLHGEDTLGADHHPFMGLMLQSPVPSEDIGVRIIEVVDIETVCAPVSALRIVHLRLARDIHGPSRRLVWRRRPDMSDQTVINKSRIKFRPFRYR